MFDLHPLVYFLIGSGWLIYGVTLYREKVLTTNWIQIQAAVLEHELKEVSFRGQKGLSHHLLYSYCIEELEFVGSKKTMNSDMQYPNSAKNRERLENYVSKYSAGADIDVYVNPDDYSDSVVERENDVVPYICFSVGTSLILFSLYRVYS